VRWTAIGVSYTSVLVAASFFAGFAWSTPSIDAAESARVRNEIAHANTSQLLLRAHSRNEEAAMQSIREIAEQPDWSILVAAVGQRCGDEIFLADLAMAGNSRQDSDPSPKPSDPSSRNLVLHLKGFGQSQEAVSSFVLRLQELSIFDRVKLLQTTRQAFAGADAYAFQVDCTIGIGPGGAGGQ
jgi:hypothetical protein